MAERNTTDVLSGDLSDNANQKWLYDRFMKQVLAVVDRQIGDGWKHAVDVNDVAHQAWLAAIMKIMRKDAARPNSPAFRALLFTIAKRRAMNAVRDAQSMKRDAGRNEQLPEDATSIGENRITPADEAAVHLSFQEVIAVLMQEKEEQRRLINVLAVTLDLTAVEMRAILKRNPSIPEPDLLPESVINQQIKKAQKILRHLMGDE